MIILNAIKKESTITNTKGSKYYATTYDSNLDVFTMLSRFTKEEIIIKKFTQALEENENLALANLLYILDIRRGKGERRLFKTIYKDLCQNNPKQATRILPFISKLGRYDYILEGIDTKIEKETINLIKNQLNQDLTNDKPSLLAKWLPSHRTHGKNSKLANKIIKHLNITEKEYRKNLSTLRNKINIVEKHLTNKDYSAIEFSKVPAKAMIKYKEAFKRHTPEEFKNYKELLKAGKTKINTKGLFSYEIIKNILFKTEPDEELYSLMWENQKNILDGCENNILVVADTSASMKDYGAIPYCTSIGLAIYIAERNKGVFKNHFITFSEEPKLQELKGRTIVDKMKNMQTINARNTDIDKVFDLILITAIKYNLENKDLPSQIIIISDMEFDYGIHSKNGTNFERWKNAFKEEGFKLPTIIFWNVSANTGGIPVTKFDEDVAIISGFSVNILENLLTLKDYSPNKLMLEKLKPYLQMLKTKI